MKNFIYTTLLVFATLFCQAFGAQYEPPTIFDTTICVRKGDTIKMCEYKEQILQLLERREKERWSGCCDMVSVELKDGPEIDPIGDEMKQLKYVENWPVIIINGRKAAFSLEVTYIRHLRCSDILKCKDDTAPASLAMWHLFGNLLSVPETSTTTTISDTAYISTIHKVKLTYRFGMSFPDITFKIQGDSCFNNYTTTTLLWVPDSYSACRLKWFKPENVGMEEEYNDTMSKVRLYPLDNNYLYPIICTVTACQGEPRSDTVFIGRPTPTPKIEDLACIAANETSFEVAVKEPDSRFSYHWTVEGLESSRIIDTQQGASVTMAVPQKETVRLQLYSTGGCKASDTVDNVLHRSVVAGNIQLQGDTNCVFIGDTLRFVLQNAPQEPLVWKSETCVDTLQGNEEFICNTTGLNTTSFKVSVSSKNCPESDSHTFNIREDFKVSLGASPMCVSVRDSNVIRLISNGINPEIHWYGNGIDIDSTTYSTKDSILLRLVNPGDPNLYVKVAAAECGKFSKDSIALRPKPEKPSLDTLWNALTPCIPLGIADTIELRVQPQEGVKFDWDFSDNAKFQRVSESHNHSISVATDFDLLDPKEDKIIYINVYTSTIGCMDTLSRTDILYATGAGLGEEWSLGTKKTRAGLFVGFQQNDEPILMEPTEDFEAYVYEWYKNGIEEEDGGIAVKIFNDDDYPIDLRCVLRDVNCIWKNDDGCPSVYNKIIYDESESLYGSIYNQNEKTLSDNKQGNTILNRHPIPMEDYVMREVIVLSPNPVYAGMQVKVEGICETEAFTVECYSPQGKCLFRTTSKGDTFTLPTDNYAAGVYIVKIQLQGKSFPIVKKLIIL